ncbi:hypothetical protein [Actinomadura sp. 21ATH]|uniref:hypothetical protein n=1 Tax=Actinomadura sp. 21ATH TaxID=1735444 RepID=UPI0035C1347F
MSYLNAQTLLDLAVLLATLLGVTVGTAACPFSLISAAGWLLAAAGFGGAMALSLAGRDATAAAMLLAGAVTSGVLVASGLLRGARSGGAR